jgi:hypothetical protein
MKIAERGAGGQHTGKQGTQPFASVGEQRSFDRLARQRSKLSTLRRSCWTAPRPLCRVAQAKAPRAALLLSVRADRCGERWRTGTESVPYRDANAQFGGTGQSPSLHERRAAASRARASTAGRAGRLPPDANKRRQHD